MNAPFDVRAKLEEMGKALEGTKRLVILNHDNPDPDGISCGFTLQAIVTQLYKIPCIVRYLGMIGRAENREMIRLLKLKIRALKKNELRPGDGIALVDCQPNTGNVSLPSKINPLIVIDHHPLRKTTKVPFCDVREDHGATATMLAEYLLATGLEITTQIATALCYGISSETQHLGREATTKDANTYSALFATANKKILSQIENPKLPRDYFITLNRAIHHSSVYKNAIISCLGVIKAPDFVPIVADMLLKCERISWTLCMGRHENKILVSVRTSRKNADSGSLLRKVIGKRGTAGGHGMIAGGQISCSTMTDMNCDEVENELKVKFLKLLGHSETGEMIPLLIEEKTA